MYKRQVKGFLDADVLFEPGSAFDYNSMNSYMLSAIVKRKTGLGLSAYLRPVSYTHLCIPGKPQPITAGTTFPSRKTSTGAPSEGNTSSRGACAPAFRTASRMRASIRLSSQEN